MTPSLFLKYISLVNPNLSLVKYFLKKKPRHGSYPTLGANKEFLVEKMKRILDSMVKGMLRTES
jgi:hypothetical protein